MLVKLPLLVACALVLVGCQKSPGEQCLDSFRANLKDPDSGKVLSFEDGTLRYTATNSYGARTQGKALCKEYNGKWFRDEPRKMLMVLEAVEKTLDDYNDCRAAGKSKDVCAGDSLALRLVDQDGVNTDRLTREVRVKLGF